MRITNHAVRFILSILLLGSSTSAKWPQLHGIKGAKVLCNYKVGIAKVGLAIRSLRFPDFIPLVHGNLINSFRPIASGYEISHATRVSGAVTELHPLQRRLQKMNAAGFVIKRSTFGVHPVPMENTLLLARLDAISSQYGIVHLWLVCSGIYSRAQKKRQMLYAKSLIRDYADNIQRALGVRDCPNQPAVSGLCNNRANTLSGVTLQELRRDGDHKRFPTSTLTNMMPSPRHISNVIFKGQNDKVAPMNVNALMVFFGQFIDHEIVGTSGELIDTDAAAPIPRVEDNEKMEFTRSAVLRFPYSECCQIPYSRGRVWESPPFNFLTSFIDGGAIYGSSNLRAYTLRTFRNGKLILKRTGGDTQLPFNNRKHLPFLLENEGENDAGNLFAAGDLRANENTFLLAIHTLFAREHNRVCKMLQEWLKRYKMRQYLKDGWLYRQAKQIVIAELQSVTFNEFVPAMLGEGALGKYTGYNPHVDARISTFHSSFAYRWGHSGVPEILEIKDKRGTTRRRTLKEMFFNTKLYEEHGLEHIILAAMNTRAADIDTTVIESLRDFLFNEHEAGVLDLVSLNIQRARDFGVPDYLSVQSTFKTGSGLQNIEPEMQQQLLKLYGHATKIDAYVGGLAETKKKGSILGPLLHGINVDQFRRLRDGDRFYYENMVWNPVVADMPLVQRIRKHQIRLLDVIYANTKISKADVGSRGSVFKVDAAL